MSEEEKNNLVEKEIIKRIDYILDKANYLDFEGKKEYVSFKREYLQDLFDLCKKQQKEIEEIRQWKYVIDTYEDLDKLKELELIKIKGKEYISKDKIKEKIENLEDYIQENSDEQDYWGSEHQENIYAKIEILEELLGDK